MSSGELKKIEGLPIIDSRSTSRSKKALANQVGSALNVHGFFYLKGHGVSRKLRNDLSNLARTFFNLPAEEKNRIHMKQAGRAWRGYFPVGAELTQNVADIKEGIYFGVEHPDDHPLLMAKEPMHGKNQWPTNPKLSRLKPVVTDYMEHLAMVANEVLSLVAVSLSLGSNYFKTRFTDDPTMLFRIFNYPAACEARGLGVGEHTDMGFLTILLQGEGSGLQVKINESQWLDVPVIEDTFVVNIGDMLEVWTAGLLKATPHRVLGQDKADRMSFPFFFDPNWQAKLTPIQDDLLYNAKERYAPKVQMQRWDGLDLSRLGQMTYGEFVWNKIKDVFPWLAVDR